MFKAYTSELSPEVSSFLARGLNEAFSGSGNVDIEDLPVNETLVLTTREAVEDNSVVCVVYSTTADSYIEGKDRGLKADRNRYFCYRGDMDTLATWFDSMFDTHTVDTLNTQSYTPSYDQYNDSSPYGQNTYGVPTQSNAPQEVPANNPYGYQQGYPNPVGVSNVTPMGGQHFPMGNQQVPMGNQRVPAGIPSSNYNIDSIRTDNAILMKQMNDLRQKYGEQSAVLAGKEDQIKELKDTISKLQMTEQESRRQVSEIDSALMQSKTRVEKLTNQLRNTLSMEEASNLKAQNNDSLAKVGKANSERDSYKKSLAETEKLLAAKTREASQLKEEKAQLNADLIRINKSRNTPATESNTWFSREGEAKSNTPVLVSSYKSSVTYPNTSVIASGSDDSNMQTIKLLSEVLTKVYDKGEDPEDYSGILGKFNQSNSTVILELSGDTSIDYRYRLSNVKSCVSWLDNGGPLSSVMDFTNHNNQYYMCVGLGYINDAWLMNVDWDARLTELSERGMNVYISVGSLSSNIKRLLFKTLGIRLSNSVVVTKGTFTNIRNTISNTAGFGSSFPYKVNITRPAKGVGAFYGKFVGAASLFISDDSLVPKAVGGQN